MFTLPKLGHQHVDLTGGLVLADSCGLMLTVKGMFVLKTCTVRVMSTDA